MFDVHVGKGRQTIKYMYTLHKYSCSACRMYIRNYRVCALMKTRVNNKEGKRVSNALYTSCNMFSASNVTFSRAHVTSSRG